MTVPEKALGPEEKLDVEWSSDNEAVCTVTEKGRLYFHSEGTANITMSSNGIVKTVPVIVLPSSGQFIEEYRIPQSYINAISGVTASTELGWSILADFRNGGTAAEDAKKFVMEKYKYATGPSSWFAGGGYCIEMGGWDNIHSGLEDDDLEGGGLANLFMWTKVKLGPNAQKLRAYFQYRETDATFKYKLRFTLIDPATKDVVHLSDWLTGEFKTDPNLAAGESFIESDIPEELRNKTVLMLLEYDDIDYLSRKADIQMKYHHFLNPMTYNKNLYFRNRTEACLNSKDLYRSYKRVENTFSIDTSSQSRYWSLSPKHRDVLYILSYMFVYASDLI